MSESINRRTALAMLAALPGVACGKVAKRGNPVVHSARVVDAVGMSSGLVGVVFPDNPYVFWVKPPPWQMAKNAHVVVLGEEDKRWDIGFRPIRIFTSEVD